MLRARDYMDFSRPLISSFDVSYQTLVRAVENDDPLEPHLHAVDDLTTRQFNSIVFVACTKSEAVLDCLLSARRRTFTRSDLLHAMGIACKRDQVGILESLRGSFSDTFSRIVHCTFEGHEHTKFEPLTIAFVNSSRNAYNWLAENGMGIGELPPDAEESKDLLVEIAIENGDDFLLSKVLEYVQH